MFVSHPTFELFIANFKAAGGLGVRPHKNELLPLSISVLKMGSMGAVEWVLHEGINLHTEN